MTSCFQGASVDVLNGKGDTPLHIACENACLECTELLLRNGADVTKRSGSGFSSLHLVINASSPLQFIALPQNDAYKTVGFLFVNVKHIVAIALIAACINCAFVFKPQRTNQICPFFL